MIEKLTGSVRRFMEAGGQEVNDYPAIPAQETVQLRRELLGEEYGEYVTAEKSIALAAVMGERVTDHHFINLADALADMVYVIVGTAISYGINLDAALEEVCRSNDTKFVDGQLIRREDGKILKPEGYEPPDLAAVLFPQEKEVTL